MLERATGFFESGARRLLASPRTAVRSRRALHTAFWHHGACEINLPSWWIALLQVPSLSKEDRLRRHSQEAAASLPTHNLGIGLLEFLYPSKALALIQRFALSEGPYLSNSSRRNAAKRLVRTYTSASQEAQVEHEDTSEPDVLPWLEHTTATESILAKALPEERRGIWRKDSYTDKDWKFEILLRMSRIERRHERNHALEAYSRWEEGITKALHDVAADRASEAYSRLEQESKKEPQDLGAVLKLLKPLTSPQWAGRSLLLFDQIPLTERISMHYGCAIEAALKLDDLGRATDLYKEAVARKKVTLHGTSALLKYTVEWEVWEVASEIWAMYNSLRPPSGNRLPIWYRTEGAGLRMLLQKASAVADYALSSIKSIHSSKSAMIAPFAKDLIMRTFTVHDEDLDIQEHHNLFSKLTKLVDPTFSDYEVAVTQLWRLPGLHYWTAALRLFYDLRERSLTSSNLQNSKPSMSFLKTVLKIAFTVGDHDDVKMVFEEVRRYYGLPSRGSYRLMIGDYAKHGNARAVDQLFQEYRRLYGESDNPTVYKSLLHVHYVRGEVEQVVKSFESFHREYGYCPDVECWNMVVATHVRLGDVEGATIWFHRLCVNKNGATPNSRSFAIMMGMHAGRGDVEAVEDLSREAQRQNLPEITGMVDAQVLARIKNGDMFGAERLAKLATETPRPEPYTRMWNYVLHGWALRGLSRKVEVLFGLMGKKGIPVDGMTYAAVMTSFAVNRQPKAADKVLRADLPREGIRASAFHYAIVMRGFLATKEYGKVFTVYDQMLAQKVKPDVTSQAILLKAATALETKSLESSVSKGGSVELSRSEEVFNQAIERMEHSDTTMSDPIMNVSLTQPNQTYNSLYFEILIAVYGRMKAYDKVGQLFAQYVKTAKRRGLGSDLSPPIRMLSSLMMAFDGMGEHEQVARCWHLARKNGELLARSARANDTSEPGWVLNARRHLLNLPLMHYLRSLAHQHRIEEMISTVEAVQRDGFVLDSKVLNLYIQQLAVHGREAEAFALCEEKLIARWSLWYVYHGDEVKRRPAIRQLSGGSHWKWIRSRPCEPKKGRPSYETMLYLCKAVVLLRRRMTVDDSARMQILHLQQVAPRTMEQVAKMPKIDDVLQERILHGSRSIGIERP